MTLFLFWLVIALAFVFGLTNGFIDGGGLVSTVITTRVLDPLPALLLVAAGEMVGLYLLGQQVANTLGHHMISFPKDTSTIRQLAVLVSALIGALAWNTTMWRLALPSSSSHALVGGIAGAFVTAYGRSGIAWPLFWRIFLLLGIVPLAGVVVGFLLTKILYWGGQFMTPAVSHVFHAFQVVALAGVALVHGSNDGQKSMAMMIMAFLALGRSAAPLPNLPWAVYFVCGGALALGVIFGSRRMIRTLGKRLYRVQELQGLCAQTSAALLVGASSLAGYPMSTTQVVSTSVLGSGIAVHPRGIRWELVWDIMVVWVVTIPASAAVAALFSYVVSKAL